MIRRNGGVAKVVFGVCVFFVGVYLFYLYYDVSGRLKQTERTAERYRREGETASAQLQELSMSKSELQQRCDSDKQEFTNRLSSLQQQYKMLKSQHEDMENDFGRLQNEKETEMEERKKLDEERTLEYNKFKQEKILEVSSLKDAVANLEREKQELTEEISKLKEQLQNNLHEAAKDKQMIGSLEKELNDQKQQRLADQTLLLQYQAQLTQAKNMLQQQAAEQLKIQQQVQQQQQQQQVQQQQNPVLGQGMLNMQNQNPNRLNQQPNLQAGQQLFMGQGNRNMFNLPFGGSKVNPQQQAWKPLQEHQQQQQQHPNNVIGAIPQEQAFQPVVNEGVIQANEMLKSLEEKHKPVDPDVLEQHQQQHQILPPKEKPDLENYHKDSNIEGNPPQEPAKSLDKEEEGAGDDTHDNRIQQQGPVNLQVQEPNLKPEEDLKYRPQKPDAVDNQLQPNQPVDDSLKQEQMELPVRPLAADNNFMHQPDNVNMGAKPMHQGLEDNNIEKEEHLRPLQDDDKYDADEYENDENDDNDDEY